MLDLAVEDADADADEADADLEADAEIEDAADDTDTATELKDAAVAEASFGDTKLVFVRVTDALAVGLSPVASIVLLAAAGLPPDNTAPPPLDPPLEPPNDPLRPPVGAGELTSLAAAPPIAWSCIVIGLH